MKYTYNDTILRKYFPLKYTSSAGFTHEQKKGITRKGIGLFATTMKDMNYLKLWECLGKKNCWSVGRG